jgi:hypothetical protein
LVSFLALAVLLEALGLPARAATMPDWVPLQFDATTAARHATDDAVVLLDHHRCEVLPDGGRTCVRRFAVKVLTRDGEDAARVDLHRSSFVRYSKVKGWVMRPSGRVETFDEEDGTLRSLGNVMELDDTELLSLAPPDAVPGTVFAVQYRYECASDWPQDLLQVQGAWPVDVFQVDVETRRGWRVLSTVGEGRNPGPAGESAGGTWRFVDVRAQRAAAGGGWVPAPPRLAMTLEPIPENGEPRFATWGGVAGWLATLFRSAMERNASIDRLVKELPTEQVAAIGAAGRIARSIWYFAVSVGWGGWVPRPTETTLSRGFGDCKDKTALMLALLRARGLEAVPVAIISPRDDFVAPDLPTFRAFNHAIVGIVWKGDAAPGMAIVDAPGIGRLRLFDATLEPDSAFDLSPALDGATGLAMDPRTTGLLRVPPPSPDRNRADVHETWRRADAGFEVSVAVAMGGSLRARFVDEDGRPARGRDLREWVLESAAERCPAFENLEVTDVLPVDELRWRFTYGYRCPNPWGRFGSFLALPLGEFVDLGALPMPLAGPEGSVYAGLPRTVSQKVEIELPPAAERSGPGAIKVANDVGSVSQEVSFAAGRLVVSRSFTLAMAVLPLEKRDAVLALRDPLAAINAGVVVVRESGAKP